MPQRLPLPSPPPHPFPLPPSPPLPHPIPFVPPHPLPPPPPPRRPHNTKPSLSIKRKTLLRRKKLKCARPRAPAGCCGAGGDDPRRAGQERRPSPTPGGGVVRGERRLGSRRGGRRHGRREGASGRRDGAKEPRAASPAEPRALQSDRPAEAKQNKNSPYVASYPYMLVSIDYTNRGGRRRRRPRERRPSPLRPPARPLRLSLSGGAFPRSSSGHEGRNPARASHPFALRSAAGRAASPAPQRPPGGQSGDGGRLGAL